MTFSDNEGDIIAETPPKFKKKKIRALNTVGPLKTTETCTECPKNLTNEFCVFRNSVVNINQLYVENMNARYNRPYVFYEMKDVITFTEQYQPANLNIKLVGIYRQNSINTHYLIEFKQSCAEIIPLKIGIDFKLSNSIPATDQAIELYGFVHFHKKSGTCFPIFMVNFWNNVNGDFNRYLNGLRQQKVYVPLCFKEFVKEDSDVSKCTDYTFAEFDESCLNKNVDHLEQIYQEFNWIMDISEDVFK